MSRTDPGAIRVRHLSAAAIHAAVDAAVDRFRSEQWQGGGLLVDVFSIAEFRLGLDLLPVPGRRRDSDVDAALFSDLHTVAVDAENLAP